jgi:hypothetical protein
MATASAPAAARSASESKAGTPSGSSARRSGDRVTTPANSTPAAAARNGAWNSRPPEPYPTRPNRTASVMAAASHTRAEKRFRPRPPGCDHGGMTARRPSMPSPDPGLSGVR